MNQSQQLFDRAQVVTPGGVHSPVRSFQAVGGTPVFMAKAQGAYLYDEDGKSYIDFVGSWGPMILGHTHPQVVSAVQEAATKGLSFGATNRLAVEMAEKVVDLMDNIEMVRFVNSGTEASMTALRLARAYTEKNKILKFNGCYHGHEDSLLVKAGSGLATLGLSSSAGVPASVVEHTLVAEFNNLAQVAQLFEQYSTDIAAVILEIVPGNANCISPSPDFLQGLRQLCDQYHSLLIADEVMTGFRVALGGAQQKYRLKPDLTILGKVIGGGLPVGAIGGSNRLMRLLAPVGAVYQAGTLSGNPLAMTAGLTTLELISTDPHFHQQLETQAQKFIAGVLRSAKKYGITMGGVVEGGLFGLWFGQSKIANLTDIQQCDQALFKRFFHAMLQQGVYLPPSPFEACFISAAHNDTVIESAINCADRSLAQLVK